MPNEIVRANPSKKKRIWLLFLLFFSHFSLPAAETHSQNHSAHINSFLIVIKHFRYFFSQRLCEEGEEEESKRRRIKMRRRTFWKLRKVQCFIACILVILQTGSSRFYEGMIVVQGEKIQFVTKQQLLNKQEGCCMLPACLCPSYFLFNAPSYVNLVFKHFFGRRGNVFNRFTHTLQEKQIVLIFVDVA